MKEVINQPYAEFEKELKEITDLIKKQSAEIDEQVKAFETAEKEEKRAKIMEAYEKAVGNLAEILPFSKVLDVYKRQQLGIHQVKRYEPVTFEFWRLSCTKFGYHSN